MRRGPLRHRITIESPTEVPDASGEVDITWGTFVQRWAEIRGLTGRELFLAQQTAGQVDHEIKIDHTEGITPKMRATKDGRVFDIEVALDPDGRKVKTVIFAKELV